MYVARRVGVGVEVITLIGVMWLITTLGTDTDALVAKVNGVGQSEGAV